jgi:CRP-like cAMP-binding protein
MYIELNLHLMNARQYSWRCFLGLIEKVQSLVIRHRCDVSVLKPLRMEDDFDTQVRLVLAKNGSQRSYDDLLILKSKISKMDFMKSIFSTLHPRQIDDLCRCMNLEIFEENQYVFHQGDLGDKFYVVLSGAVDILLKQRTGNVFVDAEGKKVEEFTEKLVFTCREGGQFGERALDYDEPRAASIRTLCNTELITVTQAAYKKLLKAPVYETPLDQPGNKGHTIRVLSLTRDKRKTNELHAVAEYLANHVPFFRKFSKEQREEMCRMCELVRVWGKTVLFKQGSIGQAFYIILTGSVDVVVAHTNDEGANTEIMVNTLHEGASFGERALESEDLIRTASIVTSESLTELIIISREEYQRIVSVMREGDMMERVRLLRKTQQFSCIELPYLHELAKLMESKIFRLDTVLYSLGEVSKEIFFIHKGECHMDRVMTLENGKTEIIELGRVGPGAVLGDYCLLADSYYDEVRRTLPVHLLFSLTPRRCSFERLQWRQLIAAHLSSRRSTSSTP